MISSKHLVELMLQENTAHFPVAPQTSQPLCCKLLWPPCEKFTLWVEAAYDLRQEPRLTWGRAEELYEK